MAHFFWLFSKWMRSGMHSSVAFFISWEAVLTPPADTHFRHAGSRVALQRHPLEQATHTLMIATCHAPVTSPLPISSARLSLSNQIELPYHNRIITLAFSDIVWLEGAGNYTYIHTRDNRRYLTSKTLKRLEPILLDPAFCRVHKSALINLAYLAQVNFSTSPHLYLLNNQFITISRRRLPATRRQVKSYQQMTAGTKLLA